MDKVYSKLVNYNQLSNIRAQADQAGKTIVFTTGVFDLLHIGHIKHLSTAKSFGDLLVVSVGNDETVRLLKGSSRPIYPEEQRALMIASLETADYVFVSEELGKIDHEKSISLLKPDFFFVPGDDSAIAQKAKLIEKYGGKILKTERTPVKNAEGISTTKILEQINKDSPT